jgi:hypothetical protein
MGAHYPLYEDCSSTEETYRALYFQLMNAIEAAEQAGIDLSLIEESLRLTPEQRALQHQSALAMALQLEEAYRASRGQRRNDGTQSTAAEALRR